MAEKYIGNISGGSIETLNANITDRSLAEGTFVVVEDKCEKYYGTLANITNVSNAAYLSTSDIALDPRLKNMIKKNCLKTVGNVLLDMEEKDGNVRRVRSIPGIGAKIRMAEQSDMELLFGKEDATHKHIYGTREENLPICLDMKQLLSRSFGVFGTSGSGKSYTMKVVLSETIKCGLTGLLIFDAHNEYAYEDVNPETGKRIPGLKTLYPNDVITASVGRASKVNGHPVDLNLMIDITDVSVNDILSMKDMFGLTDYAPLVLTAAREELSMSKASGKKDTVGWLQRFHALSYDDVYVEVPQDTGMLDDQGNPVVKYIRVISDACLTGFANNHGLQPMAVKSVWTKLKPLFQKSYITKSGNQSTIKDLIDYLRKGKHVVLSFDGMQSEMDYLLVSNILTYRIRNEWIDMMNAYRANSQNPQPRPLAIVVEEAHRLLSNEAARHTTFGTIAREMRKYGIILGIIDQRPSQISQEVASQIGTRIICSLQDQDDIKNATAGLANKAGLQKVLASLEPKKEALLVGMGVPVPMVVQPVRYDETYWKDTAYGKGVASVSQPASQEVKQDAGNTADVIPEFNIEALLNPTPKNEKKSEVKKERKTTVVETVKEDKPKENEMDIMSFLMPDPTPAPAAKAVKEEPVQPEANNLFDIFSAL